MALLSLCLTHLGLYCGKASHMLPHLRVAYLLGDQAKFSGCLQIGPRRFGQNKLNQGQLTVSILSDMLGSSFSLEAKRFSHRQFRLTGASVVVHLVVVVVVAYLTVGQKSCFAAWSMKLELEPELILDTHSLRLIATHTHVDTRTLCWRAQAGVELCCHCEAR